MRLSLLALLMCSGCYYGPVFKLKKQAKLACPEEMQGWGGGLTYHVSEGGRGDGAFDYSPASPAIDRIEGAYDIRLGTFWWWSHHKAGSFLTGEHAEGVGTIWDDGDLDLEYELEKEWADQVKTTYQVRERRLGCEAQKITMKDGETLEYEAGRFAGNGFDYTVEFPFYGLPITAEGRREKNGEYVETIDVSEEGLAYWYEETGSADGEAYRSFEQQIGNVSSDGSFKREADGSHDVYVRYKSGAETVWYYATDPEGNGTGTLEYGEGESCDLTFTNHVCQRWDCTKGADGECSVPVEVPRW